MTNAAHRFDNNVRYRGDDHPNQRQLTPSYVLEPCRRALGGTIQLDPCNEPDNPTNAEQFYSPPQDGATEPWNAQTIFVNPPYSRARERWARRCVSAAANGASVILLIPSHTDTRLFHDVAPSADGALFIQGRVKFGILRPNRRQEAASHPSCLLVWNVETAPLLDLGTFMAVA